MRVLINRGARHWRWRFFLTLLLLAPLNAVFANEHELSLGEAVQRTVGNSPQLSRFQWRLKAIDGQRQTADQAPAYELGLEAENIAGSNNYSGVDQAEFTVSLSSVIELGGQREARVALMDSSYTLVQAEKKATALEVLGRVTQNYIRTLAQQQRLGLAQEAVKLADDALQLVRRRVARGAAPKAEQLRAKAALKRAELALATATAEFESRKFSLATLWGADKPAFERLSGELFVFADVPSFQVLFERVSETPAIEVYASEQRQRRAEIALARSAGSGDLRWSLGVRRLQESDDTALTAGVSIPLYSGSRQRGAVQTAQAELAVLSVEKRVWLLALKANLFRRWQAYRQSVSTVKTLKNEVLPLLQAAHDQTRRAYERGLYGYTAWIDARRELLDTQLALINAASRALVNQALIEQLTATSLATAMPNQAPAAEAGS